MVIKRLFIVLCVLSIVTGCYKDDTDLGSLTTNALDPDYTGPSYITVISSTSEVITPAVTAHALEIEVNSSGFPDNVSYKLSVVDLTTGSEELVSPTVTGGDVFSYKKFDITIGQQYCYDLSVWVDYSTGRADNFCDVL